MCLIIRSRCLQSGRPVYKRVKKYQEVDNWVDPFINRSTGLWTSRPVYNRAALTIGSEHIYIQNIRYIQQNRTYQFNIFPCGIVNYNQIYAYIWNSSSLELLKWALLRFIHLKETINMRTRNNMYTMSTQYLWCCRSIPSMERNIFETNESFLFLALIMQIFPSQSLRIFLIILFLIFSLVFNSSGWIRIANSW